MKPTVRSSTVADRSGYLLFPAKPSMRLAEISERARLRALAARLVRFDRLATITHLRALSMIDRLGMPA